MKCIPFLAVAALTLQFVTSLADDDCHCLSNGNGTDNHTCTITSSGTVAASVFLQTDNISILITWNRTCSNFQLNITNDGTRHLCTDVTDSPNKPSCETPMQKVTVVTQNATGTLTGNWEATPSHGRSEGPHPTTANNEETAPLSGICLPEQLYLCIGVYASLLLDLFIASVVLYLCARRGSPTAVPTPEGALVPQEEAEPTKHKKTEGHPAKETTEGNLNAELTTDVWMG